jgi:4-oxalomesaconate tautomerase
MRGGTSKGLYCRAEDLPGDRRARDRVLLAAMGSPDPRQIDGLGGAHPLTSKVAVVSPSTRDDADVDYLFLQVAVDTATVSTGQNCGNILAGVGPFAIEQGMVAPREGTTSVRVHMVNTGGLAVLSVPTPGGTVFYTGDTRIDGVPGTAAPIRIAFEATAGASCGALLPTGNARDELDGLELTCIDNGMPVVLLRAADLGKTGAESPQELEADTTLRRRIEAVRRQAGPLMRLGDVAEKTVPKVTLLSPPRHGGIVHTRSFIPHRVHEAIGVLGAISVATACVLPGSVAEGLAAVPADSAGHGLDIEHPTGFFSVEIELASTGSTVEVRRSSLIRTARPLMQGIAFIPGAAWEGPA